MAKQIRCLMDGAGVVAYILGGVVVMGGGEWVEIREPSVVQVSQQGRGGAAGSRSASARPRGEIQRRDQSLTRRNVPALASSSDASPEQRSCLLACPLPRAVGLRVREDETTRVSHRRLVDLVQPQG